MFLGGLFDNPETLQKTTLVLNTVVLICALLVFEFAYARVPKSKKKQLRYFYPILIVLGVLLAVAIYKQGAA
jgi:heme/copper-type cytochrome/quinol oxidase subunit 3